jgi:hypothetical protein
MKLSIYINRKASIYNIVKLENIVSVSWILWLGIRHGGRITHGGLGLRPIERRPTKV